ncbi:MAG: hypothetical protein K2M42_09220 [Oscillospiraceae bacterium]|nr:hypothetical protein [Oscillospiraceae bacterium]
MKNEEKAVRLFCAISDIGDDLVDDAKMPPANAKAPAWRRWGALAACLCLIALAGAGVWHWMGQFDGPLPPDPDLPPAACDTLPGGITPVLRVGDTLYEWTGMSVEPFLDGSGSYSSMGGGTTYLSEGFREYGEISGVTVEEPTEDLQLQAGFEASGTVFVSKEYPAVVYVLLHTDWFAEEGSYVRFVSDALGNNELVSWHGRAYHFSYYYSDSPVLEVLPEGCEPIGHLHYVGDNSIPAGDLETNRRSDDYAKPLEGRKVYAVPGDDSVLYVYEPRYRQENGHSAWHPFWRVCRLWEP